MIYLIRTTYYNIKNKEVIDLLKIGFTKDGSKKRRYSQYRLHNPLYKVLFEIPNATEDDERKVHKTL